jgi:hypothetical protein
MGIRILMTGEKKSEFHRKISGCSTQPVNKPWPLLEPCLSGCFTILVTVPVQRRRLAPRYVKSGDIMLEKHWVVVVSESDNVGGT